MSQKRDMVHTSVKWNTTPCRPTHDDEAAMNDGHLFVACTSKMRGSFDYALRAPLRMTARLFFGRDDEAKQ